jgi:SWI/SNF-related matrix-associated actin-dependent regulator of chromatin subfamily A-like protein 1
MTREVSEAIRKMRFEAQQKRNAELLAQIHAKEAAPVVVKKEDEEPPKPVLPPVTIKALQFTGAMIMIESDYREDLVEVLRGVEGRSYRGSKQNLIPLAEWKKFVAAATALPAVSIKMDKELHDELDWHLNAPVWLVAVGLRWFECKFGPRAQQTPMYAIPGAEYKVEQKMWRVPLTEGWRLYQKLEGIDGVVYTDEAQSMIVGQIEARGMLDKIAKMNRGVKYLDYDFGTGHKLREFQEVGAEFIEAAGGNVIVADEMGLGKTWQAMAYALKNDFRVMVICPASLKPNWARQIRTLTGVRPSVLQGGEPTQGDLIRFLTDPPKYSIINYDIVGRAMKYKKVWKDERGFTHEDDQVRYLWVELINMAKPDLVIVDEGHYIKNIDSNRSQAVRQLKVPRIVFLTGTPVLNRPGELWPMLTMIAPEQFPAHETFLNQYTYDGKSAKNVDELRTLMRPLMIRRLKKDVQKDLPPINRDNIPHELSEKALKLYRKVEQGVYTAIEAYSPTGQGGQEMGITNILAQIQRLKMVCAIDKADHTAELAIQAYEETDESSPRKVLIFSQFKAVAYAIYQRLADDGCLCFVKRTSSDFVTANNEERDRLVQQFQTDPNIKYMVVTEKTTKEGHDITAAGSTIFNDVFWTPAGHEQAEGRAYGRLDNPHTINSYYMITEMGGDSIEEWIMELLAEKMHMINEVVEGVEASRDVSVVMELIQKMKDSMWTRKR